MSLGYYSRYAWSGAAARARMKRAGRTPNGHWLWSAKEDAKVRRLYPNYKALRRALPKRNDNGLRARVRTLGIQKRRHVWLAREVSQLRRLYTNGAAYAELQAVFPYLSQASIRGKVWHLGLSRKRSLKLLGVPVIDSIRSRASALGFSLRELDREVRSKGYYQKASRLVSGRSVARAVRLLDGELLVSWSG